MMFSISAVKPSYIQIAQWRSVLTRLFKFVRSVDFVILELLRRLVVRAARTLLTKIRASSAQQYPWQHDADDSITPHDEIPSCPPAMMTVRLVLTVPEAEVIEDTSSVGEKGIFILHDKPYYYLHCIPFFVTVFRKKVHCALSQSELRSVFMYIIICVIVLINNPCPHNSSPCLHNSKFIIVSC
jgi:hypothetical protein